MKLTASQRIAIEHRGANLLVSASAGAGKTEVLARRCVSLLTDPGAPCTLDELLVVTFTRAAAAELRVRVARMLREAAAQAADTELRRQLRRQALLIDAADIGTIDAWCGRLVREHYAEAGVDVQFSVLSEQDARLLRAEELARLMEWVHRGAEPLAREAQDWLAHAPAPDDGFLRRLITGLSSFREHLVNPEPWFTHARERAADVAGAAQHALALLAEALRAECRFQAEQLGGVLPHADPLARDALTTYAAALADWHARLADPDALVFVASEIGEFSLPKPPRGQAEPVLVLEVRERWLAARLQKHWDSTCIDELLLNAPRVAQRTATLLALESRYQSQLAAAKQRQAALEFGDVLRLALDLLGEPERGPQRRPTDIARRLQRRYAHVLVDEYQDTSPVQVEILRLVSHAAPEPGNRFMVGDVKQSIYGFRHAEPQLFTDLAAEYVADGASGRLCRLVDNFRSHADVLNALNVLFAGLFHPALGGTAYGPDERLQAGRAATELANATLPPGPRVSVHVIEAERGHRGPVEPDDEAAEVELVEREAQLAAAQIRALVASGAQIPQRDPDGQTNLRPLKLADVVILLRAAAQRAGLVARVLRANGIPCVTGGRESVLDAIEVRDLRTILELLVNRRQDVPLAAYLRSPLGRLQPADLLEIRTACATPRADFFTAVEHYRRLRARESLAVLLDTALQRLDDWARAACEEELPVLLERLLRESGLRLLAAALPNGAQRLAQLRSIQALADAFAAGGQGGVAEFVEYLSDLAEEELDPGALATGDEDVVRVMTIHGAKGLEFPVVFLLGAGTAFNRRRQAEPLQCDAQLGPGLRCQDYPARTTLTAATHHVLARRVAQRELAEELRLLYVATTRARERLVIIGHARPGLWDERRSLAAARPGAPPLISRLGAAHALEWILMAAAGALDVARPPLAVHLHTPDAIPVPPPGAAPEPAAEPPPWTSADEAWLAAGRQVLAAEPHSPLAEFPALVSVSALKDAALHAPDSDTARALAEPGPVLQPPAFAATAATPDGRTMGTAAHRFLELADLADLASVAAVAAQRDRLAAAGRLPPDLAALVPLEDVAWLAASPAGRLLAAHAAHVRRELPFVYAHPLADTTEQTIVRGIIDCLVELPAGLALFDYKTDLPRDPADWAERLAGYSVQLQLYAEAAAAIFDRPVVQAALLFLRARRSIDVPLARPTLRTLLAARPA